MKRINLGSWRKAQDHLYTYINMRIQFTTNKSQGGISGNAPYEAIGFPMTHSESAPCPTCNKECVYEVYSYATLLWRKCSGCDLEYCNVKYYSKQTRDLQFILAQASCAFHMRLAAQIDAETTAIKAFNKARTAGEYSWYRRGFPVATHEKLGHINGDLVGIDDRDLFQEKKWRG